MSNVLALRDSLAGLAGDVGTHASTVAAEFGRAVLLCAQHGNKNPLERAHEFMGTLKGTSKGTSKAVKSVRDGYGAAIAAAGFLVVTEKTITDARDKGEKRISAPDALALSVVVSEAFILAFATRYNAPAKARAEKPAVVKIDVEALTAERDAWKAKAQQAFGEVSALKSQLSALQATAAARAVWTDAEPVEA